MKSPISRSLSIGLLGLLMVSYASFSVASSTTKQSQCVVSSSTHKAKKHRHHRVGKHHSSYRYYYTDTSSCCCNYFYGCTKPTYRCKTEYYHHRGKNKVRIEICEPLSYSCCMNGCNSQ